MLRLSSKLRLAVIIAVWISSMEEKAAAETPQSSRTATSNAHELGATLGLTYGIPSSDQSPLAGLQWRMPVTHRRDTLSGVYGGAEVGAQYFSRWTLDVGSSTRPSFGGFGGLILGYEFGGLGGSSVTIAPELRTNFLVLRKPRMNGSDVWAVGARQTLGPAVRYYVTANWVFYLAPLSFGYQALTDGLGTEAVLRTEFGFTYRFANARHAPPRAYSVVAPPSTHELGLAFGFVGLSGTLPADILPALQWRVHLPSDRTFDPHSGLYFGIEAGPQHVVEQPWPGFTGGILFGYEIAPAEDVGFSIAPDLRLSVTIYGVETESDSARTALLGVGFIGPLFRFYPARHWTFHVLPVSVGAAVKIAGSASEQDRIPALRTECGMAYRF